MKFKKKESTLPTKEKRKKTRSWPRKKDLTFFFYKFPPQMRLISLPDTDCVVGV